MHPRFPSAQLRAVYDVLAKGRKKVKKPKFNPLGPPPKPVDNSYMAEEDWARLINRLRLTDLFTNWHRTGGETGELNPGACVSTDASTQTDEQP